MSKSPALRAVILAVPETARTLPPRERVAFLSRHARKALQISAAESNLTIGAALKDRDGRPQPVKGVYWSLTHKPAYVGAIVARRRVGIDIETIVQRKTEALFNKVADSDEWALIGSRFVGRISPVLDGEGSGTESGRNRFGRSFPLPGGGDSRCKQPDRSNQAPQNDR